MARKHLPLTIGGAEFEITGKGFSRAMTANVRSGGTPRSRFRGLEVDDQLELRRLDDRQVSRLGALEYLAGVPESKCCA